MNYKTLKFSGHAIGQMFRRSISRDDVKAVIREGEIIKEYPDDTPYPSFLTLGFAQGRPIHIVFAFDNQTETAIIVTAYIPDKSLWTDDFRNRRGEL